MYDLKHRKMILSSLLLLGCCFLFVNAASAVDVFLTSDSISGNSSQDVNNLHSIENYVEKNTTLQNDTPTTVTVDPKAPKPGEGERAVDSAKTGGVAVYLAASCPGTIKAVAYKASRTNKGVIFVNVGSLNLKTTAVLRRSWDDNFSDMYFAGIKNPYQFLRNAGVWVIQPNVDCAGGTQDEKNRFIANGISAIIANNPGLTSCNGRVYSASLILKHQVSPATVAKIANGIYTSNYYKKPIKSSYSGYRTSTFLLMVTDYMNGAIYKPIYVANPTNSRVVSTYSGTLTKTDCRAIASIVNSYMRKYRRAPNYVAYGGKIIGFKDLLLMYATMTRSHTTKSKMTLPKRYTFKRVSTYADAKSVQKVRVKYKVRLKYKSWYKKWYRSYGKWRYNWRYIWKYRWVYRYKWVYA